MLAQLEVATTRDQYQLSKTTPRPLLEVLNHAASASNDRKQKIELLGFLGLLAGTCLGVGLACLFDARDLGLDDGSADGRLGMPVVGHLPPPSAPRSLMLFPNRMAPGGMLSRAVRSALEFAMMTRGRPARSVMVVSAVDGEGKSTTAGNLAASFAALDRTGHLVDLDLRRPELHRLLKLPQHPGVTDIVLGGSRALWECVHHVAPASGNDSKLGSIQQHGALDFLAAGSATRLPGDVTASAALQALGAQPTRTSYDLVVVDSPPALPVSDALSLSAAVEAPSG